MTCPEPVEGNRQQAAVLRRTARFRISRYTPKSPVELVPECRSRGSRLTNIEDPAFLGRSQ